MSIVALLAFSIALLLAVLVSNLAERTIISLAVLFLIAGFVVGPGVLSLVGIKPDSTFFNGFIELALVTVLFTDGMHIGFGDIKSVWLLPGRALLLGMPLALLVMAVLAHFVTGLPWGESLLVGAVLSPTDPIFASAIVGREEIPSAIRRLLNVESGLNDGLALPLVLIILGLIGVTQLDILGWVGQVFLGLGVGAAIAWIAVRLQHSHVLKAVNIYRPLLVFSIGLLVYSLASTLHANYFLGAFAAGVIIATLDPSLRDSFSQIGEMLTMLFKLASLLLLGALLSFEFLSTIQLRDYVFALLVLIVARPVSVVISMLGTKLKRHELVTIAWFGPRGFASVLYGLLVLRSGLPAAGHLFHLVAVVIIGSIFLHSTTDVVAVDWFRRRRQQREADASREEPPFQKDQASLEDHPLQENQASQGDQGAREEEAVEG